MRALALLLVVCAASAAQGLAVTYGDKGIQTLAYKGLALADLAANPGDAFSIRHMLVTDLKGNAQSQYGWGDTYKTRKFDTRTRTVTTLYDWGSIAVQFSGNGNTLNVLATETNTAGSGYILQGAAIYVVNLRLPKMPDAWGNLNYPQVAYSTFGPSVITGDWGSGEVTAVNPSVTDKLYMGFLHDGSGKPNYYPVISTVPPDGLPSFAPQYSAPVMPGHSYRFRMSIRFGPSGTPHAKMAADVYSAWAKAYPLTAAIKTWDRRPMGTVFLATSPAGKDSSRPAGCGVKSGNPRNYFHDCKINVSTASGLQAFQTKVLQLGQQVVTVAQKYSWQGAITWDIEGEEWPQTTSYVCSPEQVAQIAPEMESVVTGQTGAFAPYNGQKLDDAYFGIQTSAGLKVGVCTRPQQFVLKGDGTASQNFVSDPDAASVLNTKMQFAHSRWGATMFYADTFVHQDGSNLEPSYFRRLMQANPKFLLMPEINSQNYAVPAAFQFAAPFYNFEYHTDFGTAADVPDVYNFYPARATGNGMSGPFGVNLVNDVNPAVLNKHRAALIKSAAQGDILMGHADYDQANDAAIEQIYKAAQERDSSALNERERGGSSNSLRSLSSK